MFQLIQFALCSKIESERCDDETALMPMKRSPRDQFLKITKT